MKKLIVSAFMVTLFATMVLGQATAPSIEGNWLGSLDLGGAKLRLVFKITKPPPATRRNLIVPIRAQLTWTSIR